MYFPNENFAMRIPTLSYTCDEIPCKASSDEKNTNATLNIFFEVLVIKVGILERLSDGEMFVITDNMLDIIITGETNEEISMDNALRNNVIPLWYTVTVVPAPIVIKTENKIGKII